MFEPTAIQKLNMRQTLLFCRNEIAAILGDFVMEPNDQATRDTIVKRVDTMMEGVRKNGVVQAYEILCDDTLNTEEVIKNNELKLKVTISGNISVSEDKALPVCLSFTISADSTPEEPESPIITLI